MCHTLAESHLDGPRFESRGGQKGREHDQSAKSDSAT